MGSGIEPGGYTLDEVWCRGEGGVEGSEDDRKLPDDGSFIGRLFVVVRGGWVEQYDKMSVIGTDSLH